MIKVSPSIKKSFVIEVITGAVICSTTIGSGTAVFSSLEQEKKIKLNAIK